MPMFDAIILLAGKGTRTGLSSNKINYLINGIPLYQYCLWQFLAIGECRQCILVVNEDEYPSFKIREEGKIKVVKGGATRSASVLCGLKATDAEYVLVHDGARYNIQKEDILNVYQALLKYPSVSLCKNPCESIRDVNEGMLDRNLLKVVATPQGFKKEMLLSSLSREKNPAFFDDCEAVEKHYGIKPLLLQGRYDNYKVTTKEDLMYASYLLGEKTFKIGYAKDTHKLISGRKLILGGVVIPYPLGLAGHSDADVVFHAVAEAIIGALGLGDLGTLFPDTDPEYLDMSSSYFVLRAKELMKEREYKINNLDITVYLEEPNLKDYKAEIRRNIARLLETDESSVNVKATRNEGLGYIGRKQGISADAACLLEKSRKVMQ